MTKKRLIARSPVDGERRVALITGCGPAPGIGFATAPALARACMAVSITSTMQRIQARAAELERAGDEVLSVAVAAQGRLLQCRRSDSADQVVAGSIFWLRRK